MIQVESMVENPLADASTDITFEQNTTTELRNHNLPSASEVGSESPVAYVVTISNIIPDSDVIAISEYRSRNMIVTSRSERFQLLYRYKLFRVCISLLIVGVIIYPIGIKLCVDDSVPCCDQENICHGASSTTAGTSVSGPCDNTTMSDDLSNLCNTYCNQFDSLQCYEYSYTCNDPSNIFGQICVPAQQCCKSTAGEALEEFGVILLIIMSVFIAILTVWASCTRSGSTLMKNDWIPCVWI
jgi:hypothetical protein